MRQSLRRACQPTWVLVGSSRGLRRDQAVVPRNLEIRENLNLSRIKSRIPAADGEVETLPSRPLWCLRRRGETGCLFFLKKYELPLESRKQDWVCLIDGYVFPALSTLSSRWEAFRNYWIREQTIVCQSVPQVARPECTLTALYPPTLLTPMIRDLGYFHPMNHTARVPLWFAWSLTRVSGQTDGGMGPEEADGKGRGRRILKLEVLVVPAWGHGDHGMKVKVRGWSLWLTTACPCFFQVENSNSWFRGVRTCAPLWTSSPMEPGCKLYAVGTSLSATRSRACALAPRSDGGSRNPPPTSIYSFFSSQQRITCASAWVSDVMLKCLSSPIHAVTHTPLIPKPGAQHAFLFL